MGNDQDLLLLPIIISVVICTIRLAYYTFKLDHYLRDNHTEKWKELTTIQGLGYGFQNPFRQMPFIFNKEDFGDKEVLRCKVKIRNHVLFLLLCFPTSFYVLFLRNTSS